MSSILLLQGCQFESKESPVAMTVGLYAPERLEEPNRTTIAVSIKHPKNLDKVDFKVTHYASGHSKMFKTTRRDDQFVSSIPFDETGIYVIEGMIHANHTIYTPKTLIRVGDVSKEEFSRAKNDFQMNGMQEKEKEKHHH